MSRKTEEDRVRWPPYRYAEARALDKKLAGDWQTLDFLDDYWNIVYDDKDAEQYFLLRSAWILERRGLSYKKIGSILNIDPGAVGALVTGKNRRPNLAEMYLNRQGLGQPRSGWKWVLDCTPKPTSPYPRGVQIPPKIGGHTDVVEFLRQFPRIPDSNPNLPFFGVSSDWVETHKPELFGYLVAFLVGDGGKYYSEYEGRARHYRKSAMTTNMKRTESNYRVLRYVQLCLDCIGIPSDEIEANKLPDGYEVIRWNSIYSNVITWIVRVCLGLKAGERTSTNPIVMPWLLGTPKEFIVAFLQGIMDSDGYVNKKGRYVEISSIPNSKYYELLIQRLGFEAKTYPQNDLHPTKVRLDVPTAQQIPILNPIVRSYRYEELLKH